jgi:Sec-independent protein secretion pathway component TatC
LALLVIVLVVWGRLDFYYLNILAELPGRKTSFSDTEVGLIQPAPSEWALVTVWVIGKAGLLIALPIWIALRLLDFILGGLARPAKKISNSRIFWRILVCIIVALVCVTITVAIRRGTGYDGSSALANTLLNLAPLAVVFLTWFATSPKKSN